MKAGSGAALLMLTCSLALTYSSALVLLPLPRKVRMLARMYPVNVHPNQHQRGGNGGGEPYSYQDLAIYIQSYISNCESRSLRKPVRSIPSQGGERDFAVAVIGCDKDYKSNFDARQCLGKYERISDESADRPCVFLMLGLRLTSSNGVFPACFHAFVFWYPSFYVSLARRPHWIEPFASVRHALRLAIAACCIIGARVQPRPASLSELLQCIRPYLEVPQLPAFPRAHSYLLMPTSGTSGYLTNESGSLMEFAFHAQLASESGFPLQNEDWKLVVMYDVPRR